MKPLEQRLSEVCEQASQALIESDGQTVPTLILFTTDGIYPYPLRFENPIEKEKALEVIKATAQLIHAQQAIYITSGEATKVSGAEGPEQTKCLLFVGEEVGKRTAIFRPFNIREGKVVLGEKRFTEDCDPSVLDGIFAKYN